MNLLKKNTYSSLSNDNEINFSISDVIQPTKQKKNSFFSSILGKNPASKVQHFSAVQKDNRAFK